METFTDITTTVSLTTNETSSFNNLPVAISVIYALIGTTGVLGNGLVIYVLARMSMGRHATNVFIVNQSAIDLFTSTMLIGCYLTPEVDLAMTDLPRGLAKFTCTVWLSKYLFWGAVMASTGNLMCLTLERYMAVVCPLRYQRLFRLPRAIWLAVLPWVVGYAYQSYWLTLQYLDPATGGCIHGSPGALTQKVIGIVVFTVQYILPLAFMAFVYANIAKSLKNRVGPGANDANRHRAEETTSSHNTASTRPSAVGQRPSDDGRNLRSRVRKNVIKTFLLVCMAYFICWTPNQVCYFYYNMGGDIDYESPMFFASISLAFCNMIANPFIYCSSYQQFRRGLRKTFPCLGLGGRGDLHTGETVSATVSNSTYRG